MNMARIRGTWIQQANSKHWPHVVKANGLTLLWLVWPCVCVFDGGNGEHQAAAAAAVDANVVETEEEIPDVELLTVVAAVLAGAAAAAGGNGCDVAGGNSLTALYLKT